jgi:hypothetical protein
MKRRRGSIMGSDSAFGEPFYKEMKFTVYSDICHYGTKTDIETADRTFCISVGGKASVKELESLTALIAKLLNEHYGM